MIRYECPGCRAVLETPDSLAGKTDRCPACGTVARAPQGRGAGAPPTGGGKTARRRRSMSRAVAALVVVTAAGIVATMAAAKWDNTTEGARLPDPMGPTAMGQTESPAPATPAGLAMPPKPDAPGPVKPLTGGLRKPVGLRARAGDMAAPAELRAEGYAKYALPVRAGTRKANQRTRLRRHAIVVVATFPAEWLVPSETAYKALKQSFASFRSRTRIPAREFCKVIDRKRFALRTAEGNILTSTGLATWTRDGKLAAQLVSSITQYGKAKPVSTAAVPVCWVGSEADLRLPMVLECFGRQATVPAKVLSHRDVVVTLGKTYRMFEEFKVDLPKLDLGKFTPPRFDPAMLRPTINPARYAPPPVRPVPNWLRSRPRRRAVSVPVVQKSAEEAAATLWQLAQNFLANRMPGKAKESLSKLVRDYPASSLATDAKRKLDDLEPRE